jgi:hypothetical protein
LASKTIATVIKQANHEITREKRTTQGMQERICIMAISNPPRFKVVLATKLTILSISRRSTLGTTFGQHPSTFTFSLLEVNRAIVMD